MKAITLTKAASFLYKTDEENPIRQDIYKLTEGKHPKDEIEGVSCEIMAVVEEYRKTIDNNKKKRR